MKKLAALVVLLVLLAFSSSGLAQFGEVIYEIDGMDEVTVQNVEYRTVDGTPFTMDVYYPPDMDTSSQFPVVILVNGFRDSNVYHRQGVKTKDFDLNTSWCRLIAASGLTAVVYESEQPDDLIELVSYIRQNAETLQIDGDRIGIMAASSNGHTAASYIMQRNREYVKAAVCYYCDLITPDGKHNAELDEFFENFPGPGDRTIYLTTELEPVEQLRTDLPVLMVRAGQDPMMNEVIDHFVTQSLVHNVPLTLINYAEGMHGFDYQQDTESSHEIIRFTLEFFKSNLIEE